ncbi:MAG TPA: carboxypeptidase-like regulatory domain-containing protein [Gemmatimonadales bacterium]
MIIRKRFLAALLTGVVVLVRPVRAQTIRGRILDSVSQASISGALVELRDATDTPLRQVFSGATGGWEFLVDSGQRVQVRIAAIGYARHAPITIDVKPGLTVIPTIILAPIVVSLPELHAMGGKRSCGKSELTPETFGGLFDGAHSALQVMDATMRSGHLAFNVEVVHSIVMKKQRDSSVSADTSAESLRAWPVQSIPADLLVQIGFERPASTAEGGGELYFGPDLQVLFSDWFLDTHCFTLDKGNGHGDSVFIRFDPLGKPKHVDLSGTLVLDRATLTLRGLSYVHRNLPDGVPEKSAGGEMHFGEPSPGLWVPVDWAIWAPITKTSRTISRPIIISSGPSGRGGFAPRVTSIPSQSSTLVQVVGREEKHGRLVRILPVPGS